MIQPESLRNQQNSMGFNKRWHLVRDQEAGGSLRQAQGRQIHSPRPSSSENYLYSPFTSKRPRNFRVALPIIVREKTAYSWRRAELSDFRRIAGCTRSMDRMVFG